MSLGKDLASIRKSQNLTLEDIQNATKIPLHILKSIEDGRIFSDFEENTTYIRSFVRSYAKALKIEDDAIIQALDEKQAGTYSGSLLSEGQQENIDDTFDAEDEDVTDDEYPQPTTPPQKNRPADKTPEPKTTISAESDGVDWANLGHSYNPGRKSSRMWMAAIVVLVIVGLGTAAFFFGDALWGDDTEDPVEEVADDATQDELPPAPADTADINNETLVPANQGDSEADADSTVRNQGNLAALGDTLTVSVYAAYGQLEPVRVTSDFNGQTNPFWVEQGVAHMFDFRDTLMVRGQYSRLLLLFNGHVIENPRQNYFSPENDAIMITRSVLSQDEYLAPAPEEFPLEVGPPDSVSYLIRF
ncbi:helix-turn-helix domain-containing protein [Gracilimonas mengyeensis]|uniref:Helix-turn-helix domain-containing protein n=1 Tax=Gracilimonas mengyeensis TaxID=1302730 RepID=A0A521FLH5_9BACT|nr:helix-turn-helix domain-containing protein [Gracilimonas mengyeensis]SMO97057.1 Helix-turn-helix domain-containing protein [Gracilimonas mengyeensis]